MVNPNRKTVTVAMDRGFFDNIFEPGRKATQEKFGLTNLSQKDFFKMMKNSGMKMNVPLKSIGGINEFPKTRKRKKR